MTKSEIYDQLYDRAIKLMVEYNPCDIRGGICASKRLELGPNFCCTRCINLSDSGCQVTSLLCKIWVCGAIRPLLPRTFHEKIGEILKEVHESKITLGRMDKWESILPLNEKVYHSSALVEFGCNTISVPWRRGE